MDISRYIINLHSRRLSSPYCRNKKHSHHHQFAGQGRSATTAGGRQLFDPRHPQSNKEWKIFLQTSKLSAWKPIEGTWSPAENRYQWKQGFASLLQKHYQNPQSQSFLTGIATGEFDDRLMAQDFSRFGLQHIMAISGFHFSIIAGFFSIILSAILPKRAALLLLVFLLSSYFLFLGTTASIMRAWIMCLIACLGVIFRGNHIG